MASSPVTLIDYAGYKCVETSNEWKALCRALPCFASVHWPDYETKIIEDVIEGQPVVIQLWKGWCQQFLGLPEFPGGIGAEVGIYRRIPGKKIPEDLSFVPAPLRLILEGIALLEGHDLWWPYPELQTTISFSLTNQVAQNPLFVAEPEKTYWRNRWMSLSSYEQYKIDEGQRVHQKAADYKLDFVINGKSYSW